MQRNERSDQWHPVYKTISEWLAAEGGEPAEFGIAKPLRRKPSRNARTMIARRTTRKVVP